MNQDQITKLENWLEILERRHEVALDVNCFSAADHVVSELAGLIKTLILLDINPSIINAQSRLRILEKRSQAKEIL